MKAKRRKDPKRVMGGGPSLLARYFVPDKPASPTPRQRRTLRLIAMLQMGVGGVFLLKAATTLGSGTAWDDLMSASRETQPVDFWSFVVTFVVLGVFSVWMGVTIWRTQ
jgi:hypothetical protein